MTVASFVFSAVALALSGAAFGWQVLSWFMTGGRVRAELRVGARNMSGIASSAARDLKPGWFEQLASQGFSAPIVAVQVQNYGRLPVYVNKWGVANGKVEYHTIADTIGPDLPLKLEPGQEATWAMPIEPIVTLMQVSGRVGWSESVSGVVVLGTGKKVRSKGSVSLRQIMSGVT